MMPTGRSHGVLLGLVAAIMFGWVLHVGAGILQPLVIALLLASMLQPVVLLLARFKIPPPVTVIALAVLLLLGLFRVGVNITANISRWAEVPVATANEHTRDLVSGEEELRPVSAETPLDPGATTGIEGDGPKGPAGAWPGVQAKLIEKVANSDLNENLKAVAVASIEEVDVTRLVQDTLGGGFGFVRNLLLTIIYMLFIFAEQAVFRRKILSIWSDDQERARDVLNNIGRGIQRYLGVKTVISLATGVICYSAMKSLGIPYAELFGFLTFLLNYIPTFGSIVASIFPVATAFAVSSSWEKPAFIALTYLAVNLTLGNYVEPKILGRELNLSPLVIIISVVVWAGLWGVVGTFLAVPLTAALQIMLASNEATRPIAVMLSSGPPRERGRGLASRVSDLARS